MVARGVWRALMVAGVLFAVLAVASPALAYREWKHSTAVAKRSCTEGCHSGAAPTNATCTACHVGFTSRATQKCWTCHEPGQSMSTSQAAEGCVSTCHLWISAGEEPDYSTSYAHTTGVHLGASGYDKTCVDCHDVSTGAATPGDSPHHDAFDSQSPDCTGCHDGVLAATPSGHEVFGGDCSVCHDGMDRPSGECSTCHIGLAGTTIPQIVYSNTLACADSGCHGKVAIHDDTPIDAQPCTTCHAGHYESLATCVTCHPSPQTFHHETASARPLTDCTGCHDGGVATVQASHLGMGCSLFCHSGMEPVAALAVCSRCHSAERFGTVTCTTCHSAAGMIAREQVHSVTPAAGDSCTTCHESHNADLGPCATCHSLVPEAHHGVVAPASSLLRMTASSTRLTAGSSAVIRCTLADAAGAPLSGLEILLQERRLTATAFSDVARLTSARDGSASLSVSPVAGTEYRAVFEGLPAGRATMGPAIGRATIAVRQTLHLAARPAKARRGAKVRFRGSVAPTAGQLGAGRPSVRIRVERRTASRWRKVAAVTLKPNAGGAFSWTWRPKKAGSYRARATAAASPELLSGASRRISVRVR